MTAVAEQLAITEPGVFDIPAEVYHADPVPGGSLSSHGARELLACPAVYRYNLDHHVQVHSTERDEGTAAHLAVLGAGHNVVVVEAPDWRTKAAQEARDDAWAAGRTPILAHKWERIRSAQVAAVRAHPLAAALLSGGLPERVLIWRDEPTGVWCRAMVDYLHPQWMVDYKTCESAEPDIAIRRAVANLGYHIQAAHYLDGAAALGLGELPFFFIFQESSPPHVVTVARLSAEFLAAGRARIRQARQMYRDCAEVDLWPGYLPVDEIVTIQAPRWLLTTEE